VELFGFAERDRVGGAIDYAHRLTPALSAFAQGWAGAERNTLAGGPATALSPASGGSGDGQPFLAGRFARASTSSSRGVLAQPALVLRREPPVGREQLLLGGAHAVPAGLLRLRLRDIDPIDLALDEPEKRVARHLEDVGPGVRTLRRQALDADLDVADGVARLVAEHADDIALGEPEILAARPHERADPPPELGALAGRPAVPCALSGSSGHASILVFAARSQGHNSAEAGGEL
jgi:hypothetical protein